MLDSKRCYLTLIEIVNADQLPVKVIITIQSVHICTSEIKKNECFGYNICSIINQFRFLSLHKLIAILFKKIDFFIFIQNIYLCPVYFIKLNIVKSSLNLIFPNKSHIFFLRYCVHTKTRRTDFTVFIFSSFWKQNPCRISLSLNTRMWLVKCLQSLTLFTVNLIRDLVFF